jgi:hypothetical protein
MLRQCEYFDNDDEEYSTINIRIIKIYTFDYLCKSVSEVRMQESRTCEPSEHNAVTVVRSISPSLLLCITTP